MANDQLHSFERDLLTVPPRGSKAPPVSIRARDLDGNFAKCTLLPDENNPALYEIEYSEDGTRITRILPRPPDSGTFVLGAVNGRIQWLATEDC
jgi:hypothetical protein